MPVDISGNPEGPFWILPVMVTVPATVPDTSNSGDGNTALVLFAGTVKLTDLPPVENCTAGSFTGIDAVDANARFKVPRTSAGCGDASDKVTAVCCMGATLVCNPESVIGPSGGTIARTKSR